MVAAGPENPPRNQVVPVVRPPSGAISARPCHGLSGAPYTCSGGPSELGGWVHGCWGQHHRRAHPSNAFCPPHATQVRGRTSGTTPPCAFRHWGLHWGLCWVGATQSALAHSAAPLHTPLRRQERRKLTLGTIIRVWARKTVHSRAPGGGGGLIYIPALMTTLEAQLPL